MHLRLLAVMAVLGLGPAPALAADSWSDPFPGVRRLHRQTSSQNINVLVVDLCAPGVSLRATTSAEKGRTVSSFAGLVGAQAAINGDFYGSGYQTNGPAAGDGQVWGGDDHTYVAPVQFGRTRVALPEHAATGGVESWARQVVSGHPTLLHNGEVRGNNGDSLCTNRHPRTVLGFDATREKLFVAVIDGRATGRIGMTCDEMIGLMQELGVTDAVNLDGGGSSTMWIQGPGVVNYPSDGSQRVVANHLAIRATGSGDADSCPNPRFNASFIAQDAPLEMTSGQEVVVWAELRNDGNLTWDLGQTRIGTQEPQDRSSAFFKEGNWVAPNRTSGPDHSTYGPGAVGRFTWVMLAPQVDQSTLFRETFQPVQEGVTWFGPQFTMEILVHPTSGPTDPVDPAADAGVDDGDGGGNQGDGDGGPGADGDMSGGCTTAGGSAGAVLILAAVLLLLLPRNRARMGNPARQTASP